MPDPFLVAAVQMQSQEDKESNLRQALEGIDQAAQRGARLVVLPELFTCLGRPAAIVAAAEAVPGPVSDALAEVAARHGITLVAGSLAETSERADRAYNTSLVFGPDGALLARYRKRHLFDVDLPGKVTVRESSWLLPGSDDVLVQTELGSLGVAICYDLRFPESFAPLAAGGMRLLALPAAFTAHTGRDHWEVLLRARAIENQVYVIAANQWGQHNGGLSTYGRSMIIDPWGTVLSTAADQVCVIVARVEPARQDAIRAALPSLAHRGSAGKS